MAVELVVWVLVGQLEPLQRYVRLPLPIDASIR